MSEVDLDRLLREKAEPWTVVPSYVAQRIEETLHALPNREEVRRRVITRRWAYFAASLAVLGVSLGSFAMFSTPEMKSELKRLPVLASLFAKNEGKLGQSVTDQGITFTIRKVVYDGAVFSIGYSLQSDEEMSETALDFKMMVDDLPIDLIEHNKSPDVENLYLNNRKIDSRNYEGVIQTKLNRYRPATFKLQLDVTHIGNKSGKWSFALPVTWTRLLDKAASETKTIEPSLHKSNDVLSIKLNQLILDPIRTELKIHYLLKDESQNMAVAYELADDTGYIYGTAGIYGHYSGQSTEGEVRTFFGGVSSKARYLVFRPYYYNHNDALKYANQEYIRTPMNRLPTAEEPLILPQGDAGRLLITGIEYLDYRTIVHYRTEGSNPSDQSYHFSILDDDGNMLSRIAGGQSEHPIGEGTAEFKPLKPDSAITFLTQPVVPLTYIPELETRIDLPQ